MLLYIFSIFIFQLIAGLLFFIKTFFAKIKIRKCLNVQCAIFSIVACNLNSNCVNQLQISKVHSLQCMSSPCTNLHLNAIYSQCTSSMTGQGFEQSQYAMPKIQVATNRRRWFTSVFVSHM